VTGRIVFFEGGKPGRGRAPARFAGLSGFRHDRAGDTFRGWLRTITRNQILLHQRRNATSATSAAKAATQQLRLPRLDG
jgi:hypothetical protein